MKEKNDAKEKDAKEKRCKRKKTQKKKDVKEKRWPEGISFSSLLWLIGSM